MIWDQWLVQVEPRTEYTKFRHFEYLEQCERRAVVANAVARMLRDYHTRSHAGDGLLVSLGYPLTAQQMTGDQRPRDANTRKANFAEVLAYEFGREKLEYEFPVIRLRYNPNPEQSMKGDDILGFRFAAAERQLPAVLVGEAKYESAYDSRAVAQAYRTLSAGFRPHPVSIEFVATILDLRGDRIKASQVRQLRRALASSSMRIHRARLLLLATRGRPLDPFRCSEAMGQVVDNFVAVNVSFQESIDDWIAHVYEREPSND